MAAGAALVRPQGQESKLIFPLSTEQQQKYQLYTSDGFMQRLYRDCMYIACNRSAQKELIWQISKGLTAGAAIGGVLSRYGAMFFSQNEDDESLNKITRGGVVIGALIGGSVGAKNGIAKIELSPEYKRWRDKAIKEKIFPLFQKFLKDSAVLRDYLCPLSHDLISDPVKHGTKVYERAELEEWLSVCAIKYPPEELDRMSPKKKAEILITFCPNRCCHLTQDKLVPDYDYHRKVAIALKPLFDQEIDREFKEALLEYHIAMFNDRKSLMRVILEQTTARFTSGELTEEEFIAICRECKAHYALV